MFCGSEESDNDRLQDAALLVDDVGLEDFDLDIPPTTGNEYLRRVRCVCFKITEAVKGAFKKA